MASKRSRGAMNMWRANRDKKVAKAREYARRRKNAKPPFFEGARPLWPSKELQQQEPDLHPHPHCFPVCRSDPHPLQCLFSAEFSLLQAIHVLASDDNEDPRARHTFLWFKAITLQ